VSKTKTEVKPTAINAGTNSCSLYTVTVGVVYCRVGHGLGPSMGWVGSEFFHFWWVGLGWVGWRLDCV